MESKERRRRIQDFRLPRGWRRLMRRYGIAIGNLSGREHRRSLPNASDRSTAADEKAEEIVTIGSSPVVRYS